MVRNYGWYFFKWLLMTNEIDKCSQKKWFDHPNKHRLAQAHALICTQTFRPNIFLLILFTLRRPFMIDEIRRSILFYYETLCWADGKGKWQIRLYLTLYLNFMKHSIFTTLSILNKNKTKTITKERWIRLGRGEGEEEDSAINLVLCFTFPIIVYYE